MGRNTFLLLLASLLLTTAAACSSAPVLESAYDPAVLRFSGNAALKTETEFVERFPNRDSGQPNNTLAAEWLRSEFIGMGLSCYIDRWEVVNYSRLVPLQNVECEMPGESDRQIVLAAHLDQSPATVQGADNDGSGIAIILELAKIFASEPERKNTLIFLASDGEEYGMLGTRRYVEQHPDTSQIIASVSLDNVGKEFYDGLDIDPRGQFRGYGALWLQLVAQESARAASDLWVPRIPSAVDQVLSQAVPVSLMDEGPMVAAGIPAFGFAGHVPPDRAEDHWETYHTPGDVLEIQSAEVLQQVGQVTEALIRQLFTMGTFPYESGPYLFLEESHQVIRGLPLWTPMIAFVALFFVGSRAAFKKASRNGPMTWRPVLSHFLALWLPLVGSVLLLYLFVEVGLMDEYHLYPATSKDPAIFHPKWLAVGLWLVGLVALLWLARRLAGQLSRRLPAITPLHMRAGALFVVGLGGVYLLFTNPFSLLFMVPLLFWFLIGGRQNRARAVDVLYFLLGGLVVYLLCYFFGFVILRNDFAVLWYLLMMFSIGMVSFKSALMITAVLAAGLSMVVNPRWM
jgi:hypothetical protein